jgi:hypothetical protein
MLVHQEIQEILGQLEIQEIQDQMATVEMLAQPELEIQVQQERLVVAEAEAEAELLRFGQEYLIHALHHKKQKLQVIILQMQDLHLILFQYLPRPTGGTMVGIILVRQMQVLVRVDREIVRVTEQAALQALQLLLFLHILTPITLHSQLSVALEVLEIQDQ